MKCILSLSVAVLLLGNPHSARAQDKGEVTLMTAGGFIRPAIEQLIQGFEQKTGYKVKATFGSNSATKQQGASGGVFDVLIVQPPYPEVLASGNVVAGSAKTLASVAGGVAVPKGAAKPDLSTPAAVKKMLLDAKSFTYPDPARTPSGYSIAEMLKKLGIAEQMQPKLKYAQNAGGAMKLVAQGQAEIGLGFMIEMKAQPGVEVSGPLPKQISTPTGVVAFLSSHAKDPVAAKALISYLTSSKARAAYQVFIAARI